MTYNVTFFHGWSYDTNFFIEMALDLSSQSQFFDRGYYHKPNIPVLAHGKNIAITHSMGLFYLCKHYSLEDFDKIIVLSGFADFCAGRDKSMVEMLKESLVKNPEKALRRFALLCDDKKRSFPVQDINVPLLISDLDILMDRNIDKVILPYQDRIYTLHGDSDKVIAYENCQISCKENVIVADAGHVYNNKNISGVIKSWIME